MRRRRRIMAEFVMQNLDGVEIPEIENLFSDKEYEAFKNICKTKDKEKELLYSLVRSRMKILYSNKDVTEIEKKGIHYDFDLIIKEIDKAAKKLKIRPLSDYIKDHESHIAFQYAVRKRENDKENFYCPVLIFTSELYCSSEWNRIQDWFNVNHKDDIMLEILPYELSFADKSWPFTTIIASVIGEKYDRIED